MQPHELPPGQPDNILGQIPAEWNFREKSLCGLKIAQIDLDFRLLGISAIANANSQVNADFF